jgi:hypothetical protein
MKITVLLDAMPCGLVGAYLRFGGKVLSPSTRRCTLKTESVFSSETYGFYHSIWNDSQQTLNR